MRALALIFDHLLDMLFPKNAKQAAVAGLDREMLLRSCLSSSFPPESCIAPLAFRHPLVRTLIHELKYAGNRDAARISAEVLVDVISADPHLGFLLAQGKLHAIPMPASRQTLRSRGYNQCERIVEALAAKDRRINACAGLLRKVRDAPRQALIKDRRQRLSNVAGCFAVPQPERAAGKHFLLVDDVITTGATMREASNALRKAGARSVICVAVAH
jgi:predicted amidophosphoribosyltransferase